MKYLFFYTTITFLSLSTAEAKTTCRPLDVFSDGTNLTDTQRKKTDDLTDMYKEKYYLTHDFHRERLSMMMAYVKQTQSRADVQKTIARTHDDKSKQDENLRMVLFELLTSLSQQQQAQVKINLEKQEQCYGDKRAQQSAKRPKLGEVLYSELQLTPAQRSLINEIYKDRQSITTSKKYGLHHEALVEWYLQDGLSKHTSDWMFAEDIANDKAFRFSQADAMMDLLESFTLEQKQQFVRNVQTILDL